MTTLTKYFSTQGRINRRKLIVSARLESPWKRGRMCRMALVLGKATKLRYNFSKLWSCWGALKRFAPPTSSPNLAVVRRRPPMLRSRQAWKCNRAPSRRASKHFRWQRRFKTIRNVARNYIHCGSRTLCYGRPRHA